jgi:hypothetical protein
VCLNVSPVRKHTHILFRVLYPTRPRISKKRINDFSRVGAEKENIISSLSLCARNKRNVINTHAFTHVKRNSYTYNKNVFARTHGTQLSRSLCFLVRVKALWRGFRIWNFTTHARHFLSLSREKCVRFCSSAMMICWEKKFEEKRSKKQSKDEIVLSETTRARLSLSSLSLEL